MEVSLGLTTVVSVGTHMEWPNRQNSTRAGDEARRGGGGRNKASGVHLDGGAVRSNRRSSARAMAASLQARVGYNGDDDGVQRWSELTGTVGRVCEGHGQGARPGASVCVRDRWW